MDVIEDAREAEEMYPADPSPVTVEVIFAKLIVPPPGPKALEKDEIAAPIKFVVEINEDAKEAEEIYPTEPNPSTVDSKF